MSSTAADRVAVLTGAGGGIGAAIAAELAGRGYALVLAGRSADRLGEVADRLGGGAQVLAVACDVGEWDQQQRLRDAALDRFGRIDVAIAGAGSEIGAPLLDGEDTPREWLEMLRTNVLGVAFTARACAPTLARSGGRLVLIGSVVGRVAIPGSFYSATKWAVSGLAESLRPELAARGVGVTVIQPGRVDTALQPDGLEEPMLDPADVAAAVAFALGQPARASLGELVIRPAGQLI
ncbi:MAG: SDR family NAD(P)-dependent oxidoreductase [Actinobacteria bacterium]|nr:SDR family NAD(P)-dependent oxidoreductase [Actinomycetota bacterium]